MNVMNRRELLRGILGVAAATALPSEVWPFRKIFLPSQKVVLAYHPAWIRMDKVFDVTFTPASGSFLDLSRIYFTSSKSSKTSIQFGSGKVFWRPVHL